VRPIPQDKDDTVRALDLGPTDGPGFTAPRAVVVAQTLGLAAIYIVVAKLSLGLDAVAGFATLVWPPSGIAVAVLLRGGKHLWPGIALGAFLVNWWTGAAPGVAAGIACGNTIAAVAAALALRRIVGTDPLPSRQRDALALVFVVALGSTMISATTGSLSLLAGHVITPANFGPTWLAWWLGDAGGDLVVAPLLLLRAHDVRHALSGRSRLETAVIAIGVLAGAGLVFGPSGLPPTHDARQAYLLFPVLILAAARLRETGAVLATFVLSSVAIVGTARGYGPFVQGTLHESLVELQAFMLIVAASGLLLGASKAEIELNEARALFLGKTSEVLGSSLDYETTLDQAARLAVPFFADWCIVDVLDGKVLRRVAVSAADPRKAAALRDLRDHYVPDSTSRQPAALALREGRPYLRESFTPEALAETAKDEHHLALLHQLAPRSAIALPLVAQGRTVGVVTFAQAESGRRYSQRDLALGQEIARRAAIAVDNARLHRISVWWERVFEHAGWGVALTDASTGKLEIINPAYASARGYTVAELTGQPLSSVFPPDQHAHLAEQSAIAESEGRARFESVHLRKDGSRFPVFIDVVAISDPSGRVIRAANVVDISERKRVEDERARLLESEKMARAEAEQASRTKDEFLALLGHELRNPLSPMVTALQLMKLRGPGQGSAGGGSKELDVIERQVRHLVRLVDDLLDVSRVTRGKITLHKQSVEIAEIVAKAVETAGPLLEQRRHILDIDVPRTGLTVDGDPDRLAQVVTNLLTNGAKYTPPEGRIRVTARVQDGDVCLRVVDNGIGIGPGLLPQVFEPFVQGPRSSERAQGGLGLGLALVKSLVELHGGNVSVASEGADRGSEFVVRLPLRTAGATAAVDAPATPVARPGARSRILVVDDNRDAAELTAEVLRDTGYDVTVVFDPVEALKVAAGAARADARGPFDVAILDIGLPVMDGYELAHRLRAQAAPGGAGTRFIAVTGYGQENDRARSVAAGFDHHLVKPVDLDVLLDALERCRPVAGSPE
jgi:PAS domain S-box-containing protein